MRFRTGSVRIKDYRIGGLLDLEHMNLLQRIESKSSSFSKGQKRLAEYITNNFDTAAYLTACKLGKEAGVSESTVVRFA